MTVTVYTAQGCHACDRVKVWLRERGIAFAEKRADTDYATALEMVEASGQRAVPVVLTEDGAVLVGFDPDRMAAILGSA